MLATGLSIIAFVLLAAQPPASSDAASEPLWLYNGTWQVTRNGQGAAAKREVLLNQCALVGKYFTCQQSVNGAVSALLVFVPASASGEYYTQSVMPDGRGGGRGNLKIEGDRWTFLSNWNQGGKTTFYKTINVFAGKARIHFEQQESTDDKEWKTTGSGDEIRTSPGKMVVAR